MATVQNPLDTNVCLVAGSGLGRLAAWCYDHRRRVLLCWLLAVVAVIGLAGWAGSRLDGPDVDHLAGGGLVCTRPVGAEVAE